VLLRAKLLAVALLGHAPGAVYPGGACRF